MVLFNRLESIAPIEIDEFVVTLRYRREGKDIAREHEWQAEITYQDGSRRTMRGRLDKVWTADQETGIVRLLDELVSRARSEMLGLA